MHKAYAFICKAEMFLAKYTLLVLSVLVLAAAIARTIRYPINWAIDAATFLFAWCVFLGGDIAMRENRLFCITLLLDRLPPKARPSVQIANWIIIAGFLVFMIGYGIKLCFITRYRAFQGIPGLSYTWVTLSVPVGCALMLVSTVRRLRDLFHAARHGEPARVAQGPTEII
jgi:TRAP-type C4-dicarboxylate transport system permease small subunit